MNYYKIIYYTEGEDYETHETLIDDPTFKIIQKGYLQGMQEVILKDRIIKRSSIKEISPANDIIQEYLDMGVRLESLGLPPASSYEQLSERSKPEEGFKGLNDKN